MNTEQIGYSPDMSVGIDSGGLEMSWELTSMMLFPNDAAKREHYARLYGIDRVTTTLLIASQKLQNLDLPRPAMGAKYARDFNKSPNVDDRSPTKIVSELLDGESGLGLLRMIPKSYSEREIFTATGDGIFSGLCLMYFRALSEKNDFRTKSGRKATPSKSIVGAIARRHNLGRKRVEGQQPNQTSGCYYPPIPEECMGIWRSYQRVSHFWAAWIICRNNLNIPGCQDIWTGMEVEGFVDHAGRYQRFISDFFNGEVVLNSQRDIFLPVTAHLSSGLSTASDNSKEPDTGLVKDVVRETVSLYGAGKYASRKPNPTDFKN